MHAMELVNIGHIFYGTVRVKNVGWLHKGRKKMSDVAKYKYGSDKKYTLAGDAWWAYSLAEAQLDAFSLVEWHFWHV